MPLKIATWNLCLGLFHKKDYVRTILHEHELDVLTLQETEILQETDIANLNIKGYTIEIESNEKKMRIATYIRNNIPYKRRQDLEEKNIHLMIIDVESKPVTRLVSIYRTFQPQDGTTSRDHFNKQLKIIDKNITPTTVLLGDLNLDENKRYRINYNQRQLFNDFDLILGHHQLNQLVKEPTWERMVEGNLRDSIIDHIYTNDKSTITNIKLQNMNFGDHKMIVALVGIEMKKEILKIRRRNWKHYSKEALVDELSRVLWQEGIESVQELWNSYEQEILTIVDKLAPIEESKNNTKDRKHPSMRRKTNRRNNLLKKRKSRNLNETEKEELKNISKSIKSFYYEERKLKVRRRIVPGNNKSLWDAVKIAKDVEPTPLPPTIIKDSVSYKRKDAATAFAQFFEEKVKKLEKDLKVRDVVENGRRIVNSQEVNFMTLERVAECLNELKIKNCEGYDRIPLRILKEGAQILAKPLTVLFGRIYETKEIPEQWKISKIIPLHKKGKKEDVSNYRPISNLCSISKVYEKLIQKRFEDIEKENNVDLTGREQHGFKKNRSTVTATLTLQSIISRGLDRNDYAAMSSLDLSAAFDLVNLDLLLKRLRIMGIPNDLISLLDIWLRNRFSYVEANGRNSEIRENDIGTIQGSILGPILYALFIRPLYELVKLTTFADDNYLVETGHCKREVLKALELKLNKIVKWLRDSGLKVNQSKTELCVFHRVSDTEGRVVVDDVVIESKNEMNVLGLTFDNKLQWIPQISRAIKGANKSLQAIKLIRKYFTKSEIVQLLTSNFYSKLYYGAEIWHIPTLNQNCKKLLLSASANALKLCNNFYDPSLSYLELHRIHKRALPNNFCLYRHSLLLYKLFNNISPTRDWLDLNFQIVNTSRQVNFEVQNHSTYKVGNNILSNRLSILNKKITLDMLNLSLESYKIKCKALFLQ